MYFFTQTAPNKIYILDENDNQVFVSKHKEEELREGDSHPNFIDAFNAYTPPGTVIGDLVYVHYARSVENDVFEIEFTTYLYYLKVPRFFHEG